MPWWRHQMETFSALLAICAGNSPSPANSPHKGQWRGALMLTLNCARIYGRVSNRDAGYLRPHCAHHDVIVMISEMYTGACNGLSPVWCQAIPNQSRYFINSNFSSTFQRNVKKSSSSIFIQKYAPGSIAKHRYFVQASTWNFKKANTHPFAWHLLWFLLLVVPLSSFHDDPHALYLRELYGTS